MKPKYLIFTIIGIIIIACGSYYFYTQQSQNNLLQQKKQLAISDFNSNNLDDAILNAQELTKSEKTKVEGLLLLAASYVQKGSVEFKEKEYGDKAISTAQDVLAIEPSNAEAYRLIGYANEIEQNYPESIKNYDKSISLNAENAIALASRGHAYYLMGENKKAEEDFLTAISIDPKMETALLNLARLSFEAGDSKKAEEYLAKIVDPNTPSLVKADALTLSALIKGQNSDIEGALDSFNKALALNPTSPYIMVCIAQVKTALLFKNGTTIKKIDVEKIISDVEAAISINPSQTIAYITLGKLKALIGDSKGAEEQFNKAKAVVAEDITLNSIAKKNIQTEIENALSISIKEIK
ncbi:MAG: tetratricopeptide repeat protein [Candidatus Paceibacterota bacterium]